MNVYFKQLIPLVGLDALDHPSGADLGKDQPPRAAAVKAERSEQRLSAEALAKAEP